MLISWYTLLPFRLVLKYTDISLLRCARILLWNSAILDTLPHELLYFIYLSVKYQYLYVSLV